jgi:hypothetical protein
MEEMKEINTRQYPGTKKILGACFIQISIEVTKAIFL